MAGALVGAQGRLDFLADLGDGLHVGGSEVLDQHDVDALGLLDEVGALPGGELEGDVGEVFAEDFAVDPVPEAALAGLGAVGIHGGHFPEIGAFVQFGEDLAAEADGIDWIPGSVDHDHPEFDLVGDPVLGLVFAVELIDSAGGDEDVAGDVPVPHDRHELLADVAPEALERHAPVPGGSW